MLSLRLRPVLHQLRLGDGERWCGGQPVQGVRQGDQHRKPGGERGGPALLRRSLGPAPEAEALSGRLPKDQAAGARGERDGRADFRCVRHGQLRRPGQNRPLRLGAGAGAVSPVCGDLCAGRGRTGLGLGAGGDRGDLPAQRQPGPLPPAQASAGGRQL